MISALLAGAAFAGGQAVGIVRVTDADTITIGHHVVRLHAIDAPELDQLCETTDARQWRCGLWAAGEVAARYGGAKARCELLDRDRYGRAIGRCFVGAEDIGRALVRDGLAFAYRRYGSDYDQEERIARAAKRGIHASRVSPPAAHRAAKRNAPTAQAAPAPGCRIKGNISSRGVKLYHVPGQAHYAATVIRPDQGERWFCSASEARGAGWRPARR